MKRYIRASATPYHVFNEHDTKTSYYNDFLTADGLKYMQDQKNRTGEIVYMSPDEYFRECASKIFNVSQQYLEDSRSNNTDTIIEYTSAMKRGDVFPLPYINYADTAQEGLHRMMAAGDAFGWNTKFPVLVVTVYDEDTEAYRQNAYNMRRYEQYDFKKIVEQAKDSISDWDMMPPPDILTQFEQAIVSAALSPENHDIDPNNITVEAEAEDRNNNIRINVYLTSFNGLEEDRNAFSKVSVWLDDMYDLSESPFDANDYNMNR
jgi:hypothetical protein